MTKANWKVYKTTMVAYIVTTGPQPYQDGHGDEQPVWYLLRYDSDDNEIMHTCYYSYDEVVEAGERISEELGVPLENQAMQA